ncbi:hypothetical protein PMAYCL1PPCAC_05126, partial [Pristionchus mayeri]
MFIFMQSMHVYRSSQLRSSYYLLFTIHSCINIIYFVSRAILFRISSFSFICQWVLDNFGDFEYKFMPLYFLYHYTQHAQALSIIAVNINRVLTNYCYCYRNLLQYSTHALLLLTFSIPLPLTWH